MTVVPRSRSGPPRVLAHPGAARPSMLAAIRDGGGVVVDDPSDAEALNGYVARSSRNDANSTMYPGAPGTGQGNDNNCNNQK